MSPLAVSSICSPSHSSHSIPYIFPPVSHQQHTMAAETVQLGLIALISAPVIQAVFHQDTPPGETAEKEEQQGRESARRDTTTTMTDSTAPVHLAAPLALSPDAERTLFTQQALDTHLADVERPTEILEPQTAGIDKDDSLNPLDTTNTTQQESNDKMGILNVITGNISPPADMTSPAARDATNGHGIISNDVQADTHGPSSKHNFIRTDHVEEHYEPTSERPATTLTEEEKEPRTLPISAVSEERQPIPGATGDGYSPLPVLHTTGDRPASATGQTEERGEGQHAPLSVHDGIEDGVRATPAADGTYEGVRGQESILTRPP